RDSRDVYGFAIHLNGDVDCSLVGRSDHGNGGSGQARLTHIDAQALNAPVLHLEIEAAETGCGVDLEMRLAGKTEIVDVLADAADSVAAHLSFAAVGVEHPHGEVAALAGQDENQSIRPHSEI